MALNRREFIAGTAATAAFAAAPGVVRAQGSPIKIGEINSYTTIPAFTLPYRNGWQLAVEEINSGGGLVGRKVEVISRDDAGKPEDAVRLAGELVNNEKVALLAGTFLSNVGLAVSDFARQNKILFLAAEPLTDAITWSEGHRFTYRLRASTYMQSAMLAEEAAKIPAKRWATVAPNYEYGQSAVKWFKELLTRKKPDVQFVAAQFPALNRIDAGATVQAIAQANPEAIYNVTFGPDLTNFVRQGNTRGLFEKRAVVSLLTGEPEYLDALKEETPPGWIVTGYPWDQLDTPEHKTFRDAYKKAFNDYPRLGSVVGYETFRAIGAAVKKAGSVDTQKLIDAFSGLKLKSVFGPYEFRAIDHQSTLGAFVGKTAVKGNKGMMVDWRYADGKNYLPPDDVVRQLRPHGS